MKSQSPAPRPASRLAMFADRLWVVGLLAFVIGPVVALPQALSERSLPGVVRAVVAGFGVPAVLLLMAFLPGLLAIWQERRRA